MRLLHMGLLCAFAGGVAACDQGTEGTPFEPEPLAAIRFVNAVPDTMGMDYRFVDFVTNAGMFGATFRTRQEQYRPFGVGNHTIKVFLSSTDPAIASQVVTEVTQDFADGGRYTFVHSGFMRSGSSPVAAATILEDSPPTPGAGKVGLRVLNLGAGIGNLDIFVGTTATAGQTPSAAATWTGVAYGAATPYVELDTAGLRVAATAAGTTTPLVVANTAAPTGSPASGGADAIAGVRMAGSVLTMVVLPRSVAGSMAASFTTPAFGFLNDRRPN